MIKTIVTQETSLPDRHVTLSNVLIRAAQGLTLAEKRIMSACPARQQADA